MRLLAQTLSSGRELLSDRAVRVWRNHRLGRVNGRQHATDRALKRQKRARQDYEDSTGPEGEENAFFGALH